MQKAQKRPNENTKKPRLMDFKDYDYSYKRGFNRVFIYFHGEDLRPFITEEHMEKGEVPLSVMREFAKQKWPTLSLSDEDLIILRQLCMTNNFPTFKKFQHETLLDRAIIKDIANKYS